MFLASSAFAQTAMQAAPAAGETVVVTGSLIARPDYNTATPTVSVTSDALKDSGQVALEQGLIQMPQFTTATAASSPFIGGSGQVNVSLRGLGAQRNLVLLDGRRMLPSSSDGTVDINQLPASIVGNVEVITGGASAVYGSDAVSGVVNFKTKRAKDGLDVSVAFGTTEAYGGPTFDVNAIGGINSSDGRGNLTFAVEYTRRSKVNPGSIPFVLTNHSGVTPLKTGQYVPGANAPSQAAVDAYFAQYGAPAGAVPRSPGPGFGFNADGTLFTVGPNPNRAIYNLQPDYDPEGRIVTEIGAGSVRNRDYVAYPPQISLERWSSFVKGDWALGAGVHFYGEGLYTNYNAYNTSAATVTSATQVPTVPLTNPFLANILAAQPLFAAMLASRPDPTAPIQINKRFQGLGGFRNSITANNVYQFIAGLNGVLGDTMTWDVYASHGQTLSTYSNTGASSFSRVQKLLDAPDGGASLCAGGFNPFGDLQSSPACHDYSTPEISARTNITQDVVNADLQGTAFALPAGDVKFALGADYRIISFESKPDAAIQAGDPFTFNPQAPTSGSSSVKEFFGELLVPIIKDVPFFQSVNLDIAARYSDYELSGGTNTYKGDIDWAVTDTWRLRGGYERAIRAPSVNELFSGASTYYANRTVQNSSGASDPCDVRLPTRTGANAAAIRALCLAQGLPPGIIDTYASNDNQVPAIKTGSTLLRPEKGDTFTGGTVWQPEFDSPWFQNTSFSVDYYNIRIRDAISQLDFNTIVDKCFNIDGSNPNYAVSNFYCGLLGTRSQNNGQMVNVQTPFANTGGFKTAGVDVEANWLTDIGEATGWGPDAGMLTTSINGNFQDYFKQQILPGQPYQELGQTLTTAVGGPYPKYTTVSKFTYHNFGADIGLRWRFIGGLKDASYVTNKATKVPGVDSINYFDLTLGYTVPDMGTHVSLVISNVLDRDPLQVGVNPGRTNTGLYTEFGRTYLLTLDQKF
jgi:outer membrane receptor protein involved in Fe transport